MVAAKHIKKIIDMQQDRDIYAKDDAKNERNPLLNEAEPDKDKEPMKWRDWDLAQKRLKDIKIRRMSIDASNKRGVES